MRGGFHFTILESGFTIRNNPVDLMKKKTISLLTQRPPEVTLKGRVINWLLRSGRVIVVLTEFIVIIAFLSRFWLDRKNTDLSERIRQYQVILASTVDFEKEFRIFQQRLNEASKKTADERDLSTALNVIAQQVPRDIVIKSFSFRDTERPSAALSIAVYSERGLLKFIKNLTQNEKIESIRIGTIKKEKFTSGIKMEITINFRENLYE